MGKSGKKIKSEKINALRKQYDAFLEDDKKRKDRNEYILSRLEDVRSSSALVKAYVKDKSKTMKNHIMPFQKIPSYFNPPRIENDEKYLNANSHIETYSKQIEVSMIKELTKNYILIPKIQSFLPSNTDRYSRQSNEIADNDWKSKYNILNELKQNEKESVTEKKNKDKLQESIDLITSEAVLENKQKHIVSDITPVIEKVIENKHEDLITSNGTSIMLNNSRTDSLVEIPNIKQANEEINVTMKNNNKEIDQYQTTQNDYLNEKVTEGTRNKYYECERKENLCEINQDHDIYQDLNKVNSDASNSNLEQIPTHETDSKITDQQVSSEGSQVKPDNNMTENITTVVQNDDLTSADKSNISEVNDNVVGENIDNEANINIQHYESVEEHLNDQNNTNIEGDELIKDTENEQNETFYPENNEKDIEYDENNIDHQTMGYPGENENYGNEQYPYYDESQQQEPYQTEINEHNEATEHYDPNYQQGYTENYESGPQYDNQQYQEQYETNNSYENHQEQVVSNENYENVIQPNDTNFGHLQPEVTEVYQNQQDNVYTYENQTENQNYESQQYVNNQQEEYLSEVSPEQYEVQEEYIQQNTEQNVRNNMENELNTENGYAENHDTIIKDNIEEPNATDNIPIKSESSVKD